MKAPFIGLAAALALFAGLASLISRDAFFVGRGTAAPAAAETVALAAPAVDTPSFLPRASSPVLPALPVASAAPPAQPDRFRDLLRLPETAEIAAPVVSTDVVSSASIRKIGYGRVSTVRVVTTATGTYSSDALASPNILYPGVDKAPPPAVAGFSTFFALIGGTWLPLSLGRAGSFVVYGGNSSVDYVTDGRTTCLAGKGYFGCL